MPRSRPNTTLVYAPVRALSRRQQCKARIHNWPRCLRIALCYNFSLFAIALLLFHCLLPVIATDRAHRTPYTYAVLLLPARNPTNSSICIRIANRRIPLCDPYLHFARFAREYTQFRRKSPYTPAFAAELPFDDPPRLFRLPLFPQAVQRSAFLCVLVSCGTYVLSFAKTSTFIEVFARLCIFIHCVIACFSPIRLLFRPCDPFPVVAPRLAIAPRRRSADLFPSPASPPGLPFS